MNIKIVITFIILIVNFDLGFSTISKSDKKKKTHKSWKDIYDNDKIDLHTFLDKINIINKNEKIFRGVTLGYVTPWNGYGYTISKELARKFDLLSPVWLRYKFDGSRLNIEGQNDIDTGWLNDVRQQNPNITIVPRLILENWSAELFISVVRNKYKLSECITNVRKFLNHYKFDGIVLEFWLQIGIYLKDDAINFLQHIGEDFKEAKLKLVLAIPPSIYQNNQLGYINENDINQIAPSVDYFSLMTYDYAVSRPGPNAPLDWIKDCVEILSTSDSNVKSKFLLGLNFYGYYFGSDAVKPIIRHEFIELVTGSKEMDTVWSTSYKEMAFQLLNKENRRVTVWYPTLQSVDLRLKLAQHLGVAGVAIWELGQGLDYFYSVL